MVVAGFMLFGKDAQELKKKFEQVDARLNDVLMAIGGMNVDKRLGVIEHRLDKLSLDFTSEIAKVSEHLTAVVRAREDVEKSTRSFTELQRRIEQFITQRVGDSIKESMNVLKVDADRYAAVKKEIDILVGSAREFSEQAAIFTQMAQRIEKADLDLSKYAKELARTDTEKVKLMKDVDELQRMIAKMRRS